MNTLQEVQPTSKPWVARIYYGSMILYEKRFKEAWLASDELNKMAKHNLMNIPKGSRVTLDYEPTKNDQ